MPKARDPQKIDQAQQSTGSVSRKENARQNVQSYKMGHEDAVNQTVEIGKGKASAEMLVELIRGDAKPYRSAMRRRRNQIVD